MFPTATNQPPSNVFLKLVVRGRDDEYNRQYHGNKKERERMRERERENLTIRALSSLSLSISGVGDRGTLSELDFL